ncbi:hypothetical protein [Actinotalea sp. JY-7876]|uniref:hypothetical protein n=1 Tax=Actinotalea sp. JY-7876 TaxID=2758442 RepID=UPI0015F51F37|nr:hypothetical protein [Actinotalea sp. JY-7876]
MTVFFLISGAVFLLIGTAALADALWMRHHPGESVPQGLSGRNLAWFTVSAMRLLWKTVNHRKPAATEVEREAGGMLLQLLGALAALIGVLLQVL